ncbi:hypothetical protein HID58_080120, partial [Brassica napus]
MTTMMTKLLSTVSGKFQHKMRQSTPYSGAVSIEVTSPLGGNDPRRGHLAHGRGRPAPRSPRPWARMARAEVTSPMGEDDPPRGHLAHGRGRLAPRSPRPWARTARAEVTSPMGEDGPRRGHLAHGRGRPAPRSPRPWARTARAEVTSAMGEDGPRRGHLVHGRGPTYCPETGRLDRGHLAHGRGWPALRSPRPWARTARAEVTSPMGEDGPGQGHLAYGRGRPAPRSPRPWARTARAEVTSPMGEDGPRRGHLAHGRGRPAPRSPRPWARTARAEVISPMGEDGPRRDGIPSVADFVHGKNGDVSLPLLSRKKCDNNAPIKRDSSLASTAKMIFIFGGAFFALGNINPPFEANIEIYGDPEAADVGFMSGTDITVGINISTQLKLTGVCLHDPLSFVEAVWPDLFKYKKGVVRVGTQGICVGHRLMDQALK